MNATELPGGAPPDAREIRTFLVQRLADMLDIDASSIDTGQPFQSYGVDSAEGVILAGDLEEWLGVELPATLAWDYPTIRELGEHLASLGRGNTAAIETALDQVVSRNVVDEPR